MASNDRFAVHFTGKSAHCAMRREGKDALQAGVDMVRALDRVPDALPPEESALVFAGHMSAGSSYNVVAEDCVIDGTVRTMSAEARDCAEKEICRLISRFSQNAYRVSFCCSAVATRNTPSRCTARGLRLANR